MQATNIVQLPNSNLPSFDSIMADIKQLGEEEGRGKDAQVRFDLKLFEGAYLGTLSLDRDKHGIGRDDVLLLAEGYVRAQQGNVMFDAKTNSIKKLLSNGRKCVKMGGLTKLGKNQPKTTVDEFIEFWRKVRAKDASVLKTLPAGYGSADLDDCHNALMRFFTTQAKVDSLLSDEERNAFAFKRKGKVEVTRVDVLEDLRKTARKLINGKIANCHEKDDSAEVQSIVDSINKRLAAIAKGAK